MSAFFHLRSRLDEHVFAEGLEVVLPWFQAPLDFGLGLRVWGLGFKVWDLGFGGWGLGCRVWGLGFGV